MRSVRRLALCIALACYTLPLHADRSADARSQISHVAEALSAGDAAQAMLPFDKSCPQYEQLRNYFQGLAASYVLGNEVDITDEDDSDPDIKLTLSWVLTLTGFTTDATERRAAEINAVLERKNGKWLIVSFAPITIFNPMLKSAPKPSTP